MKHIFSGRTCAIATKHAKERVIAPIFEKIFGLKCVVPPVDTDTLGTFSGEIARTADPVTTLEKKASLVLESGYDIALATEGSFGPHPYAFFLPAHEELMIFWDKLNNIKIIERTVSLNPCFHGDFVSTHDELRSFLQKIDFPKHAVILRKNENDIKFLYKGLIEEKEVFEIFDRGREKFGKLYIQTDMRAHHNTTRMQVIEELAQKLAQRLLTPCPACDMPGFGIVDVERGLPCRLCHLPTQSIYYDIYGCACCDFRTKKLHNPKKKTEDPGSCSFCNP